MNTETPEFPAIAATPKARVTKSRPPKFKHRHKWPAVWSAWSAFVKWMFDTWPRND